MKTVKVSEATNIQLDWLVAKVSTENGSVYANGRLYLLNSEGHKLVAKYSPTTNWSQIGPIIDLEGVHLFQPVDSHFKPLSEWIASLPYNATSTLKRCSYGPTPLIAVARCYVASKLGDTAEVPEELN